MKHVLCAAALILVSCNNAEAQRNMTGCDMYVDFGKADMAQQWRAVNDGVMGGLSSGGPSFEDNHMVFEGVINTNGGGFSSLRSAVEHGALADASGIMLRIKSDGRGYKVTFRTDRAYRSRLISFQAPLPATPRGEWADVTVPLDALSGSIFGRPVTGAVFDRTRVREMGIILADGQDGPFRLEVDWIKHCR